MTDRATVHSQLPDSHQELDPNMPIENPPWEAGFRFSGILPWAAPSGSAAISHMSVSIDVDVSSSAYRPYLKGGVDAADAPAHPRESFSKKVQRSPEVADSCARRHRITNARREMGRCPAPQSGAGCQFDGHSSARWGDLYSRVLGRACHTCGPANPSGPIRPMRRTPRNLQPSKRYTDRRGQVFQA